MISIIIVNYNTLEYTMGCIRSILEDPSAPPFEIIVVDNASAEQGVQSLSALFPGVKLLPLSENIGFAGACNAGIGASGGDYILLLNSDTRVKPGAVAASRKILSERNDIGVTGCRLEYPDGKLQRSCQSFPSLMREIIENSPLFRLIPYPVRSRYFKGAFFRHDKPMSGCWIWGTYFMFRRMDLAKIGGKLSDKYFMYGEDMYWCYQFRRAGLKTLYDPGHSIVHFHGGSGFGTRAEISKVIIQNELDFVKEFHSSLYFYLYRKIKGWKLKRLSSKNPVLKEAADEYLA